MTEFPITGGCNCGAVRFEVTEPLVYSYYCHCTRCQRRSGAAGAPGAIPVPDSFTITSGDDKLRAWNAGDGWDKLFCEICGSHVLGRNPENGLVSIRMGSFDGDPGIRPTARHFVAYAPAWEPVGDDGLEHFPEARPGA